MTNVAKKPKTWYQKIFYFPKKLVDRKQYVEFFATVLSIPFFIILIILNLNTLKNMNNPQPTEAPRQNEERFYSAPIQKEEKPDTGTTQVSGTQAPCIKELGPVSIDSPEENETVTDNPVSVIISYDEDEEYCAAVWSYRINSGSWSDYDNKSIALYNLPQGKIKFELKVKSVVSKDEETITRNFTYKGTTTPVTPTMAQDELGTATSAPIPEN